MPIAGIAQVVRQLPTFDDPNLLVGPEGGSDAGVYRLRADLLIVQSLDFFPPLVDDPFTYGQIAAANSLSDLYAMGAIPTTAMNIVGFPDDQLSLDVLSDILRGGADRVRAAGAVVVGGHTVRDAEIKYGLSATGVVEPDRLMTNRDARPGDLLILTKPLGTGFVTTAFKMNKCPDDILAAAVANMTTLNDVACRAARQIGARAATDITGFGLAGHAIEMAQSSGVTIELNIGSLPILRGAREFARRGLKTRASATNRDFAADQILVQGNPDSIRLEMIFDAQTSGGLLVCVPPDRADDFLDAAKSDDRPSPTIIGRVIDRADKSLVLHADESHEAESST